MKLEKFPVNTCLGTIQLCPLVICCPVALLGDLEKQGNKLTLGDSSILEISFLLGVIAILENECYSGNRYSECETKCSLILFSGVPFFFTYKFLYKCGPLVKFHTSQLPEGLI